MGLLKLKTKIKLIVDPDKINVEAHCRQYPGDWITWFFDKNDTQVKFASIEPTFPQSEIYRQVKFDK